MTYSWLSFELWLTLSVNHEQFWFNLLNHWPFRQGDDERPALVARRARHDLPGRWGAKRRSGEAGFQQQLRQRGNMWLSNLSYIYKYVYIYIYIHIYIHVCTYTCNMYDIYIDVSYMYIWYRHTDGMITNCDMTNPWFQHEVPHKWWH